MDAGIADTLNRRIACDLALNLDEIDQHLGFTDEPWYRSSIAATFMGENPAATDADRAWLLGQLYSQGTTGPRFDGEAADGDWENLFTHIRAEITARRDPQSPTGQAAETCLSRVV